MNQPTQARAPAGAARSLIQRIPALAVDVALLIALTALGFVFSYRGGLVGLLSGYLLIGLRAPGARPWRRIFRAWLCLVPVLALAYAALHDFPGDEPPGPPSVVLGAGVLLCVVLPGIVAAFGGGLAWFIRRWQGPDAAPAPDDSGEGQGTGISPLVADILLLVALSAAGLFLGSIFDKAFLMWGPDDLFGYIGASLGASLVFLRAGLQERPETLVRRILGAWLAFSVVIIGTVLSVGLMHDHLSKSPSPPLREVLLFVAGSFVGVAIPALLGGGLAWWIQRLRAVRA